MKLNPPESAPRIGVTILGCFKHIGLFPAVWVSGRKKWAIALAADEEGFFNDHHSDKSLLGWMFLPDIDAEGNVVL